MKPEDKMKFIQSVNTEKDSIVIEEQPKAPVESDAMESIPENELAEENIMTTEKVIYCTQCGAANDDGSKFCIQCGTPIESIQAEETGTSEVAQLVEEVKPVRPARPKRYESQLVNVDIDEFMKHLQEKNDALLREVEAALKKEDPLASGMAEWNITPPDLLVKRAQK